MAAAPVGLVKDRPRAGVLLKPLRLEILAHARAPASASAIAAVLGRPRQMVNYHVRELARAGFLRRAGRHRKRGLVEQRYVASARAFLLAPDMLGAVGAAAPGPDAARERAATAGPAPQAVSAAYLLTLAGRLQHEISESWRQAEASGQPLAVLRHRSPLCLGRRAGAVRPGPHRRRHPRRRRTHRGRIRPYARGLPRSPGPAPAGARLLSRGREETMSTKTRTHHGRIIDTSIRIKATPDQVWNAWADPQQIANWFVDRAEGRAAPGELMVWFFDTFGYRQEVPILEAERGRTFVIGSGDAPGPDGVPYALEITIARDGGDTVMRLVNSGFSTDPAADKRFQGVVSGWHGALATMKHWLEHYPARRRTHRIVMRPVHCTEEALRPFYGTRAGRERWLLPDVPADDVVLVDTGTEVLVSWHAREAVLGLKAFGMGPQSMVALDYSTWADVPFDGDATEGRLNRALDRLVTLLG
jgi:uncharacterized protein YndB with AHSA1/START domain